MSLHESLFIQPHLLQVSDVIVLSCNVLESNELVSFTLNLPAHLQLLLEEIDCESVHSHKTIANSNLLTYHHGRMLQLPNVTEVLQGLVCFDCAIIFSQLLHYVALCFEYCEQE